MTKHEEISPRIPFGLWAYVMSDAILFAALFAAYAVLHTATAGGPDAHELFDRPFVLIETLLLLTSSFTCGLALIAARAKPAPLSASLVWAYLLATLALGLGFLGMEFYEFHSLVAAGHGWKESAFLSSFFTLVGAHGLHVAIGALWLLVLMAHLAVRGPQKTERSIFYFSLFWHFLDIVWICLFSLVYLLGSM